MIELRTLGTLGLREAAGGRELHSVTAQPKRVALLAYLAIASPRGFHRRDTLLGIFWPDSTEARARAALSQAVYTLRRMLGESIIVARGDEDLAIGAGELWCDAVAFDELLAAGERAKALELYGGDLFKGFFLSECMEFEQWLHGERARLRDKAVRAAWTLADEQAAANNVVEAGHWARRAVSFTPDDEPSVRRLVTLLAGAGDRAGALRELDAFKARMRELELDLSRETVQLEQRVRADAGSRPASAAARADAAEREAPYIAPAAPTPGVLGESQPRRGLRSSPALLAVAVGIIAIAAIAATWRTRSVEQPLFSDKRVLVAEFTNETGDTLFAALGRVTADWVAQGLSQTGLVEVVPSITAMRSARAIDEADEAPPAIIARSLAEETGASIVVSGAYYKEGDTLILHARITEGRSGRVLRGIDPVRGPADDPMAAVDQLRRRTLGALASLMDTRLSTWGAAASQPPSFEAYQLYSEALDEFFRLDTEGFRRAAARFREAAELHRGFTAPLIWATLAHINLNEWASADSLVQGLSAVRDSLPAWDRAVLAYLEAQVQGSHIAGYAAARRVAELAPQSEWLFLQAQSAYSVNRPAEAVAVYTSMDPDRGWIRAWPAYWTGLASAQHFAGQYRAEVETLRRGRLRHQDQRSLLLFGVRGLAAQGAEKEATALADSIAAADREPYAALNAYTMLARELRVHGDSAASVKAAERSLALVRAGRNDPANLGRTFRIATLYGYAERWPDVYELLRTFPLPGPVGINLGLRGIAAARTGRRAEAVAAAAELTNLELPYARGMPKLWAAGIHAHLGQRDRAVQLLRTAVDEGLPYDGRGIHAHLGVLPLRGYRPFEELVRPKR